MPGLFLRLGLGFLKAQERKRDNETFERGYQLGAADTAMKAAAEANDLRNQIAERDREFQEELRARLQQERDRVAVAERQASEALQELIRNDELFAQCEAQLYPNSVRRHFPYGVLPATETSTSNSPND